jgi:hypothetical protein
VPLNAVCTSQCSLNPDPHNSGRTRGGVDLKPQTRSEFPTASKKARSTYYGEHDVERRREEWHIERSGLAILDSSHKPSTFRSIPGEGAATFA